MKKFLGSFLFLSLSIATLTVPLIAQPTWGQSQISLNQQVEQLTEKGKQQVQQKEYQQAIQTFQQVLNIARELKNQKLEADTLNRIGIAYSNLGEKQKALDFYNQAFPIYQAVSNKSGQATVINNIGVVYYGLGKKQEALLFYNQALALYRAVNSRSGEARTLNHIGQVYSDLGDKQKALNLYNQALPLYRAESNQRGESTTLNNIGKVYSDLGERQKSLDFYNQARVLRQIARVTSNEPLAFSISGNSFLSPISGNFTVKDLNQDKIIDKSEVSDFNLSLNYEGTKISCSLSELTEFQLNDSQRYLHKLTIQGGELPVSLLDLKISCKGDNVKIYLSGLDLKVKTTIHNNHSQTTQNSNSTGTQVNVSVGTYSRTTEFGVPIFDLDIKAISQNY